MLIEVVYLTILACSVPDFVACRQMATHELNSLYRCEMTRPIAAHIYQDHLVNTMEWTFTYCYTDEEILIDNTPE